MSKLVFVHLIKEGIVEVWQTGCLCSPARLETYTSPGHMCVHEGSLWLKDPQDEFWRFGGRYRSLYRIRKDLPLCSTWEEIEVLLDIERMD